MTSTIQYSDHTGQDIHWHILGFPVTPKNSVTVRDITAQEYTR